MLIIPKRTKGLHKDCSRILFLRKGFSIERRVGAVNVEKDKRTALIARSNIYSILDLTIRAVLLSFSKRTLGRTVM